MSKRFRAATWNVLATVGADRLRPHFKSLVEDGVTLMLLQEAGGADLTRMIENEGWKTFCPDVPDVAGQWRVAWDPKVWEHRRSKAVRMSVTKFFSKTQGKEVNNYAAKVKLVHRPTGHVLRTVSYHTPAHIQVRDMPANRYQVTREAMRMLRLMAIGRRYFLAGGDDNVDEFGGFRERWGFMLDAATGLRQVQAPTSTMGARPRPGGRAIDDFRIKGLRVHDWVKVQDNPSDHHSHARAFSFRERRR